MILKTAAVLWDFFLDNTAAGRNDKTGLHTGLFQHFSFHLSEICFAFLVKNFRNRHAFVFDKERKDAYSYWSDFYINNNEERE